MHFHLTNEVLRHGLTPPLSETQGTHPQAKRPANMADHIRITRAIEKKMKQLGFTTRKANPDVRIRYRLETKKKVESRSTQRKSVWDLTDVETNILIERYREAVLTLEMFDAATNVVVWHVRCTHLLAPPDKAEKSINEAVERLFDKYPTESR
ncbi:MAG: DUF4136 domain-containing protein [Acidobacteriota bacterium]